MRYFDPDGVASWIHERLVDVDLDDIVAVLGLEHEYMRGVGISRYDGPGSPPPFEYYDPEKLACEQPVVDTARIARDAERLIGVPFGVAAEVLEAELQFLQMRGLA